MKYLLIALLVFLFAVSVFDVTVAEESATIMYLRATQAEQAGDFEQAYTLYKAILAKESSPTVTLKMFELELKRNNPDNAFKILTDAYSKYPDHGEIAFQYGFFISEQAETHEKGSKEYLALYKEANTAFQRAAADGSSEQRLVAVAVTATALKDYPQAVKVYESLINEYDIPEYYRAIAIIRLEQGKKKEAIALFEKAGELADDVQSYVRLADIYFQDNDTDNAMKYLLKVSELRPDIVVADLYLGEFYRDSKDYKKAVHFYMQAAQNMNGQARVAVLKQTGGLAIENQDYTTARDAFILALKDAPEDQQLYYYAGYCADMADDFATSRTVYEDGLKRFPEYTMLRKRLAINYLADNQPEKARATVSMIDELERDVEYYLILANSYESGGDHKTAISVLEDGINEYVYNIQLYISLAMLYENQGRYDDSIELLKTALKYDPDSAVIKNFLGYMYADLNRNLDEAEKLISEALKAEPDNYAYLDSMAWVYFRKGDYKQAHKFILQAKEVNPGDLEVNSHMQQIIDAMEKR